MKKIVLMIFLLFGSCLTAQQLITGNFMDRPFSIRFINDNTGYAAGVNQKIEGEVRKTTNGGLNWHNLQVDNSLVYTNLWIFDDHKIFVTGGGSLLVTYDAGYTWDKIYNTSTGLSGIYFINNTGYMCGAGFFNPAFLKSTDCGHSWQNLSLDTNLDLGDIDFINENTGYAVGNRIILKTTNGGVTLQQTIFNNFYLFGVDAIDSNLAFAVGYITNSDNCLILKTDNAGNDWVVNYINSNTNLNNILFVNNFVGFAAGGKGIILKTVDGGLSWNVQVLNNNAEFFDIFFVDENIGWIVGQLYPPNGLLYKTTDSGETWILQNSLTERPVEFSLIQNYPNPFNPDTKIRFKLNKLSRVILKVYDINGKEIKTLAEGDFDTGVYEVTFDGSNLASGVYFYKIEVTTLNSIIINRFSESKKMILLK